MRKLSKFIRNNLCRTYKLTKFCGNLRRINFLENQLNLGKNYELCGSLTCPSTMLYFQLLTRLEKWTSVFTAHPRSHWTPKEAGKRRKEEKGADV